MLNKHNGLSYFQVSLYFTGAKFRPMQAPFFRVRLYKKYSYPNLRRLFIMPSLKTITVSLPIAMGNEIKKVAKEEHRTISELIREAFRQYQAQRNLHTLAEEGKKATKRKKLSAKDFGGPFEE